MMTDINPEVFEKAAKKIEKGWCRGEYSKNARGAEVSTVSSEACKFCATGAICAALEVDANSRFHDGAGYYDFISKEVLGGSDLVNWNDRQKDKRRVINAFKKAAKLAREKQGPNIAQRIPAGTIYTYPGDGVCVLLEESTFRKEYNAYLGGKYVSLKTGAINDGAWVDVDKIKPSVNVSG